MKTNPSSFSARHTVSKLFLISGIALLTAVPLRTIRAQNPSSGTVGPAPGGPTATWQGTATAPGGGVNTEAACIDGVNCEVYTLTVAGTQAGWNGQKVQVELTWGSSLNEYDIYIHQGTLTGPLVSSAMNGPGLTNQTTFIDVAQWGTGVFVVHVVYDTTPNVTDHYTGTASAVPVTPVPPPPAPQDTGPKVGYENFEAPGVLTQVTQTSSGALTVEYMGRGAGEPSVGSDWKTGVANIQSDLETLHRSPNRPRVRRRANAAQSRYRQDLAYGRRWCYLGARPDGRDRIGGRPRDNRRWSVSRATDPTASTGLSERGLLLLAGHRDGLVLEER